jgi:hypothetical protein
VTSLMTDAESILLGSGIKLRAGTLPSARSTDV